MSEEQKTEQEDAPDKPYVRSGRSAAIVLTILFTCSTVMGVVAYWRYTESERFLHRDWAEISAKGSKIDAEECVPLVLEWHRNCEAMKSLCNHSIPMTMTHCLGQDRATPERVAERKAYCDAMVTPSSLGRWTFKKCKAIGVSKEHGSTRDERKACSYAFKALEEFCRRGGEGIRLGLPKKSSW